MINSFKFAWKPGLSSPRAVVASGSDVFRDELAEICRPYFAVKLAKNLQQVLKFGTPIPPEILVLDDEFPAEDDVPALTRIRLHPSFRTVPIVFATDSDVSVFLRRELASCNTAILGKPVDQSRLLDMVSHFVDIGFEADWQQAV